MNDIISYQSEQVQSMSVQQPALCLTAGRKEDHRHRCMLLVAIDNPIVCCFSTHLYTSGQSTGKIDRLFVFWYLGGRVEITRRFDRDSGSCEKDYV